MGIEFGRRLRAQRIVRGLEQADLAGPACPARYLALLETGRLEPTPEVIRHLADRLLSVPPGPHQRGAPEPWPIRDSSSGAFADRLPGL
ncbi:helix-turn-helix domain-containing protein [Sinomonas atrocyanea]|uniref:helix-turn-helix domain-containing protein n=1 Tax=Sinomonas atrocyanea TaxID=37927 RepID=UPI003D96A468